MVRTALIALSIAAAASAAAEVPRSPAAEAIGLELHADGSMSAEFVDTDLRRVLQAIAELSGFGLVLDPGVEGRVNASFNRVPRKQLLKTILRTHGLSVDGGCSRPGVSAPGNAAGPRAVLIVRPGPS
ncbi:MAG TPA: hypothetical protein VD788_09140 [Candidatus Polarisedimenticolaceae bacterium]|nr:hypothetical protein [Candidatus Polarisedimenticolaceae bacterium]